MTGRQYRKWGHMDADAIAASVYSRLIERQIAIESGRGFAYRQGELIVSERPSGSMPSGLPSPTDEQHFDEFETEEGFEEEVTHFLFTDIEDPVEQAEALRAAGFDASVNHV